MGKVQFTICTKIPEFIPREIAVQALHDHGQTIMTNPLVLEYKQIATPKEAAEDERNSHWYEITERIQYVPGLGKMGSGKISFNGCFHDMPWGLQTHIHAPLGVDLRMQYRVAGEVIGVEDHEIRELGLASLGAPEQGLYLRTDAEVKCNGVLSSFVRSQTKSATDAMVSKIVQNAERMDAEVLTKMISNERLARNATIRAARRGPEAPPPLPGQYSQNVYNAVPPSTGQYSQNAYDGPQSFVGQVPYNSQAAFSELPTQSNYKPTNGPSQNSNQSWI